MQFQKIVQFCAPPSLFPLGISGSVTSLGEGDLDPHHETRASLQPVCRKGRPAPCSRSIITSFSARAFTTLKLYFVCGKNFMKVPPWLFLEESGKAAAAAFWSRCLRLCGAAAWTGCHPCLGRNDPFRVTQALTWHHQTSCSGGSSNNNKVCSGFRGIRQEGLPQPSFLPSGLQTSLIFIFSITCILHYSWHLILY